MKIKIIKIEKRPWYELLIPTVDRHRVTYQDETGKIKKVNAWANELDNEETNQLSSLLWSLNKKLKKSDPSNLKLAEGEEVDFDKFWNDEAERIAEKAKKN